MCHVSDSRAQPKQPWAASAAVWAPNWQNGLLIWTMDPAMIWPYPLWMIWSPLSRLSLPQTEKHWNIQPQIPWSLNYIIISLILYVSMQLHYHIQKPFRSWRSPSPLIRIVRRRILGWLLKSCVQGTRQKTPAQWVLLFKSIELYNISSILNIKSILDAECGQLGVNLTWQ